MAKLQAATGTMVEGYEQEALDLSQLDEIVKEVGEENSSLIPVLQRAQNAYGYLPGYVLRAVSDHLSVPLHQVLGVATFYSQFRLTPLGRHVIHQCDGTACHVRGSQKIIEALERELGIKAGDTTPDGRVSLDVVYCLGCCSIAPASLIDGEFSGHVTPEKMLRATEVLE